ncbi:MAG: STAS domain-containing protein [Planctomycetes bacterium]|nr:STAS domain-containing protein [Planctomycetota bacterium]
MAGELEWRQLPIDTPSTAAFMLEGVFVGEQISDFTVDIGRTLQPLPKRLFLDIRRLRKIDRVGIDTMAGLAGLFAENESGFLAIVGAPEALRARLIQGAPENSFRFYDSFGQAAQKVMDGMLAALSGQFRVLPEKPGVTDEMRTCWAGIRAASVPRTQVLVLKRSFNKVSAHSFERHWNEEFSADTRNLILDVSELRTLVDEGTVWLRRISDTMRARDGLLVLVNPQPKVRVMLDMLEMGGLYRQALSVNEAEALISA